jgi:hypothetical protein
MSNDIKQMLERLATVEGRLTPTSVRHGLNSQQREVPQLPALFKPKHIRALGSRTDPKDPMDGYMVGERGQPRGNALEEAIAEIEEDMVSKVKKDLTQYLDHLEKKGHVSSELKNKARDAIERGEVEEDEVEEDLSIADKVKAAAQGFGQGLLKHVPAVGAAAQASSFINRAELGDKTGAAIAAAGMYPPLSMPLWGVELARDKHNTGSFFPDDEQIKNAAKGIPAPPSPAELQAAEFAKKAGINPNTLLPVKENAPVRTYNMEDGTCLECYGDDQTGYEIRNGEHVLPTRFSNIDHADMAVKIFQKRREANQNQDYLEER